MGNIEQELLHVIRALSVILSSGIGLEMAMKKIADGDYGEISVEFGKVLEEAAGGGNLEISLKRIQKQTRSDSFRKLISILIMGSRGDINVVESLERMGDRETQMREVETERFVDFIGSRSEMFMVLGILAPIIIIVMVFVNELLRMTPFYSGGPIPPIAVMLLLAGVLGILGKITVSTRRKEPAI